ncbi:MAG: SoxR reducing system RseC family protein [Oscillospiraceae bacterium]|nr:SoxR reducing system RseC family protein [Oscillospiraceae bacterium]
MEQLVRVREVYEDGTAQVLCIRESACSGDCHKCSGCGAVKQSMLLRAVNAIGAKPGQLVMVTSESAPVLRGAAVLYLLPVMLFILGYLLGAAWWNAGALCGGAGFLLGIALAVVYDRLVVKKRNTVYTITGYAGKDAAVSVTKGDNDLD